jgi:type IV secretory pathway VirB6-like protein
MIGEILKFVGFIALVAILGPLFVLMFMFNDESVI